MTIKEKIIEFSDQLLQYLLEYRKTHPTFRFWLRSREHNKAGDQERLNKGQWFQGSDYIFLSFHSASGHINMTRSIGWVVELDGHLVPHTHISVVWPKESDQRKVDLYLDIIGELGGFKQQTSTKFKKELDDKDIFVGLKTFLEVTYPQINAIIARHGLTDMFTIPEEKFQKQLGKVLHHRRNLYQSENTLYNSNENSIQMDEPVIPRNLILYGPPGTGKTYKLNQYKEQLFIDRDIAISSEDLLKNKVSIYPFWKILGAVIGQSKNPVSVTDLLANPLIKAKVNPTAKTPRNTLWRILQSYADESSTEMDLKYKSPIQLFHKNEDSKWAIIHDKKTELADIIEQELLDIAANPIPKPAQSVRLKTRFNFITFHQKYSYEDFIEGIKPLLRDKEIEDPVGDLQFELKKGIFYNSCLEALKLAGYESFEDCYNDTAENRAVKFEAIEGDRTRQFALFIDEINRANISAVFGELITLLEDDKRIGAENEIWVELPYTNEKFCVPANLYVIGTMNTADRSIALLDIALRRRFVFEALYPLYSKSEWWGPLLEALNQAIHNWKKNPDFFIGHAFFINKPQKDRKRILNTKIIPLLYEYCQSNAETVKRILTEAGITIKPTDIENNFQIIAE